MFSPGGKNRANDVYIPEAPLVKRREGNCEIDGKGGEGSAYKRTARELFRKAVYTELFHANRFNRVSLDFDLDAEWRTQVRALHNGSAHPNIPRQAA
jgi:hypothetical protein